MSASPTGSCYTSSIFPSYAPHPPPPGLSAPYHPHVIPLGPPLPAPVFSVSTLPVTAYLPTPPSSLALPFTTRWCSLMQEASAYQSWTSLRPLTFSPSSSSPSSSLLFVPARTVKRYSTPEPNLAVLRSSSRETTAEADRRATSARTPEQPSDVEQEEADDRAAEAATSGPQPPQPCYHSATAPHHQAVDRHIASPASATAPLSRSHYRRSSTASSGLSQPPSPGSSPSSEASIDSSQVALCVSSASASRRGTPEPLSSSDPPSSLLTLSYRSTEELFTSSSSSSYGEDIPRLGRLHLHIDNNAAAVAEEQADYAELGGMDADSSHPQTPHYPAPDAAATTVADPFRRFSYSSFTPGSVHHSPAFRRLADGGLRSAFDVGLLLSTPCAAGSAYSFASPGVESGVGQLVHRVQRRTIAARLSESAAPAVPEGDEPIIMRPNTEEREQEDAEDGEGCGGATPRTASSRRGKRSRRARDPASANKERRSSGSANGSAGGDESGTGGSSTPYSSEQENEDPNEPGARRLCEHCRRRRVDRNYGAKRFCGPKCARTFSITKR